jgi:hypothetical protein
MLAVTAGDGGCGENSTQPTARVSLVVFGVPDTGVFAHHLHVPDFGSAFITETVLVRYRALHGHRCSLLPTPMNVDRARALNYGLVCYLRKPVDEQRLIRCLRAALQSGEPSEKNS